VFPGAERTTQTPPPSPYTQQTTPPPSGGIGAISQKPDNYLVWAILSTVLCCLPAGVVSIVYSVKVNNE
ncbi:MAG: CD225/dispanin family protein, partial [Bacteroides sp.]|nr:CD225/dispanin family protein [Bacteroides sp.]